MATGAGASRGGLPREPGSSETWVGVRTLSPGIRGEDSGPAAPAPQLIYMHWMNTVVNYCGPFEYEVGYCERLKGFLDANLEWMQEEMESNKDSAYWHQVGAAATRSGMGWLWGPATVAAAALPAGRPACLLPLSASLLVCPAAQPPLCPSSSPSLPADLPFLHLSGPQLSVLPSFPLVEPQPSAPACLSRSPFRPPSVEGWLETCS